MPGTVWPTIRAELPLRFRRTDRPMKALIGHFIGRLLVLVRSLGPYAAIELLLPGGSILALLYWWHRHRLRQLVGSRDREVHRPSFALTRRLLRRCNAHPCGLAP
jgi:hypothetical protein